MKGGTIGTIGIVTAGRPVLLRRAIASVLRQCEEHARSPRVIVVDGSRQEADQLATRAVVTNLAAKGPCRLGYVGPDEAAAFRAALLDRGAPDLPLQPGRVGASRNLLLLLTAGERLLMLDDDVVCDTWALADRRDELAVMGHHSELIRTAFFSTRPDALAEATHVPCDLLAAHEALLGRSLQELAADGLDETRACGHLRHGVAGGHPYRVRVTMTGVAGDAGIYCPHRLMLASGPLRTQLCDSAETFTTAMRRREVLRIAICPALTHHPACMTMCTGVSNEDLMPPFFPHGRNSDGLFGALLAMAEPDTLFGHLPIGIVHDSDRPSERDVPAMRSASESRISDLIVSLLGPASRSARSPAAWLHEVSEGFADLGRQTTAALEAVVEGVTRARRKRELSYLEHLCRSPEYPDYYRTALVNYRDTLSAHLDRAAFFLPIEFRGHRSRSEGYHALGLALADFGALLHAWPALWEAARVQRSQGEDSSPRPVQSRRGSEA